MDSRIKETFLNSLLSLTSFLVGEGVAGVVPVELGLVEYIVGLVDGPVLLDVEVSSPE